MLKEAMNRTRARSKQILTISIIIGCSLMAGCASDRPEPQIGSAVLLSEGNMEDSNLGHFPFPRLQNSYTLDDLPVAGARHVMSAGDNFWLLISNAWGLSNMPHTEMHLMATDGTSLDASKRIGHHMQRNVWTAPFSLTAHGDWASSHNHEQGRFYANSGETDIGFDYPFPVSAAGLTEDGTLLLAPRGEGRIAQIETEELQELEYLDDPRVSQIDTDEVQERNSSNDSEELFDTFIGQPDDDDAAQNASGPFGEVVAIVPLPGDRLAFAAATGRSPEHYWEHDDLRLWYFDGDTVMPILHGAPNPIHAMPLRYSRDGYLMDLHIDSLAPGPDDMLLTISHRGPYSVETGGTYEVDGFRPRSGTGNWWPTISTVHPATGEVTEIIELEGVTPNDFQPISAAAVGDDLVFLAEGKLWLLEDAFTAEDT